jgi:transposase
MEILHQRCCGLDVHKQTVVACIRQVDPDRSIHEEVRTFSTTTRGILELGEWLAQQHVPIAAMESTGVYWKPIWNLLDGQLQLILVNAFHVKQVPGRKTDVKDCQWIAQLLSCGLLRASFVPPRPQRELRDLTRQRVCLSQDRARVANRVQKVLEDANIKLASVASDALGVSGRDMIRALIEGQLSPLKLAQLARGQLRAKIPQLEEALRGGVNAHHRFMLKQLLAQLEYLEMQILQFDQHIEEVMSPLERKAIEMLDEIPGFDRRSAQNVIAEIGCDMSRFPTSRHLASWAGISPGNNQSAGKRRSSRTAGGNPWLKRVLTQCAWAASRTRQSYFAAQHRRITARRGLKRATLAVAHSQLCVCWELLSTGEVYKDLGRNYFDQLNTERTKRRLISRLQELGYNVTLEAKPAA